jgi:hypothetical protein
MGEQKDDAGPRVRTPERRLAMTITINATHIHFNPLDLLDAGESQAVSDGSDSGSGSVSGSGAPTQPEFLTDSSMLAYCGTQMQQIDSQIQQMFADQQKQNEEQQIIAQALQVLQGNADGTLDNSGNSAPNQPQCVAMERALEQAISQIEAIDPNAPCLADLKNIHDEIMATGTGPNANGITQGYYAGSAPPDSNPTPDCNIKGSEMTQFINALQNVGTGLNNDAQLRMIQIQSLVSQQQTAVELTTNIMQSLDSAMQKVVENIHS